jgi:hypothetical protein
VLPLATGHLAVIAQDTAYGHDNLWLNDYLFFHYDGRAADVLAKLGLRGA